MQCFSTHLSSVDQLKDWLCSLPVQSNSNLLVQLFSAQGQQQAKDYAQLIQSMWPHSQLIGASCEQTFSGETLGEASTLVMVSAFEQTRLQTTVQPLSDDLESDGHRLFDALVQQDTRAMIALADGLNAAQLQLFNAFNNAKQSIPVAGGVAVSEADSGRGWVLCGQTCYSNAMVALAMNSDILRTWQDVFVEWFAIGRRFEITRAEGRRVFELDGVPAYEFYSRYLSDGRPSPFIEVQDYPLMTSAARGRGIIGPVRLFDDGSIEFSEHLSQGEQVQFCYSHSSLTQERIENGAKMLSQHQPEAIFVYNCSARAMLADGKPELELQPLSRLAPMAGYYCHGEFIRSDSQRIVHHSLTYMAFSERKPKLVPPITETRGEQNALTPLFRLIRNSLSDLDRMTVELEQQVADKSEALLASYRTDRLTGLPNHLALSEALKHQPDIEQVVVIKLTNLGNINEQYGHASGDQVLLEMTSQLQHFCRQELQQHANLFSAAPSEWVITVTRGIDDSFLEVKVSDLVDSVEHAEFELAEEFSADCLNVTLAAGIAHRQDLEDDDHSDFDELILKAHEARRRALKHNLLVCSAAQIHSERQQIRDRMAALGRVKRALLQDGVKIYGHAIFEAGSRQLAATECLVRIEEQGELFLPGSFLPAIQNTHLYSRLSRRVITQAMSVMDRRDSCYSINLSPQDLQDDHTIRLLLDGLEGLQHPDKVGFEIVETEQIQDYAKLREVIQAIRQHHAKVIIDDFGSGYSNIDEILQLEPDVLKLDGGLIKNVDSNARQRLIVSHMTQLCRSLGIATTAEFVHSELVCQIVEDLGVDYLQGFYLAKPTPLT